MPPFRLPVVAQVLFVAALLSAFGGNVAAQTPLAFGSVPNSADVSLEMNPANAVGAGAKISFRVTTRKSGYLLLVDVDATGKMSQIFPSPELLARATETNINFVKPGDPLTIPSTTAQKQGFEYVITPPAGAAAMVAILSDRPVQILDLPDASIDLKNPADAMNYLTKWMKELRIPDAATGKLEPSNWSFDVKAYSISQ